MQYMLLIYHDEARRMGAVEQSALMQEYLISTREIVEAGKFKVGEGAAPKDF